MKGRKLTEEHKRKISEGNKIAYKKGIRVAVWEGKHMPEYIKIKIGKANSGENSCNWKGGITSKDKIQRSKFRNTMQKQIFERDNYTCQLCGIRGGFLQVDHIQSWKDCIEGRFDLENCRTLCQKCHYKLTFKREMPKDVKTWGQNFKQIERMVD